MCNLYTEIRKNSKIHDVLRIKSLLDFNIKSLKNFPPSKMKMLVIEMTHSLILMKTILIIKHNHKWLKTWKELEELGEHPFLFKKKLNWSFMKTSWKC